MTDISQQRKALIARVLYGAGTASQRERQAAFENIGLAEPLKTLIQKVATQPTAVTDRDIAAVRESGLTEDEIFEIVICAAIGQSTRQYESARAALESAITKE
jgi:hypothetical protein